LLYPIWSSGHPIDSGLELAEGNARHYGPLVSIYDCVCSSEELTSFLSCFDDVLGLRNFDGVIFEDSQGQPNQIG
jgi:hypothetical protein